MRAHTSSSARAVSSMTARVSGGSYGVISPASTTDYKAVAGRQRGPGSPTRLSSLPLHDNPLSDAGTTLLRDALIGRGFGRLVLQISLLFGALVASFRATGTWAKRAPA